MTNEPTHVSLPKQAALAAIAALDYMAEKSELADRQGLPFTDESGAPLHEAARTIRAALSA